MKGFTDGPWHIEEMHDCFWIMGPDCRGHAHATVHKGVDNAQANARLIRNAPKLLDVCKLALFMIRRDDESWSVRGADTGRSAPIDDLLEDAIRDADVDWEKDEIVEALKVMVGVIQGFPDMASEPSVKQCMGFAQSTLSRYAALHPDRA